MKKKKSTSAKKRKESRTKPGEEFRNKLISHVKRVYCSKSKTIDFKDSDKMFLLIAFKRALSYDWLKEDVRKLEKREHDAKTAIYDAKNIRTGLEEAAKKMGWVEVKTEDEKKSKPKSKLKQTRLKKPILTPREENDLIRSFQSLRMFTLIPEEGEDQNKYKDEKILTKEEALEVLCKELEWQSKDALDKHIRRILIKYKKNHENSIPDEDQQLEDMLMDISELEKQLDT